MHFSISQSDFPAILKQTNSLKINSLSFKYCNWKTPALGLIVSKKYGNAIKRNLFKRRCRELFKQHFINKEKSWAIIVCPNRDNINYNELQRAFNTLVSQLND